MAQQDKNEYIVAALKERIGALAANYEAQMAEFRAEATIGLAMLQQQVADLTRENQKLKKELDAEKAKGVESAEDSD